jgi:hypothetical protein
VTTSMPPNQQLLDHRPPAAGGVPDVVQLQALAKLMDSVFEIPGTRIRLGLDALLGLFPGLGDVASTLIALYILYAARERGVPRVTLARMGANLLLDGTIGAIPIVGDVFDVFWKANNRNVELLTQHVQGETAGRPRTTTGDWLFFTALLGLLALILLGSLTATYFIATTIAAFFQS